MPHYTSTARVNYIKCSGCGLMFRRFDAAERYAYEQHVCESDTLDDDVSRLITYYRENT